MIVGTYSMASKTISISSLYKSIHEYCSDYRFDKRPDFEVKTSQADIDFESWKSIRENILESNEIINYSDDYLEELAVYRKIAEKMPEFDTFLFHGSAVSVDSIGYMFTAPSGTGKSTHAKLWCELLGNRAIMINDDKPLIKITKDRAIVYGTPFNGKHRRGNNICAPLKAICILERSKLNHIYEINADEAYITLLQQTYRPANSVSMMKTLKLLDRLKKLVRFYKLACNMDIESAETSYNTMKGEELMRLKNDFLIHKDDKDTFLIPSGNANFSGVVRGNKTLNDILELLQKDVTENEIVKSIREKYDAPNGIIERDVKKVLDNLHEIGALVG